MGRSRRGKDRPFTQVRLSIAIQRCLLAYRMRLVDNAFRGASGLQHEVYVDDLRHVPRILIEPDRLNQFVQKKTKVSSNFPSPRYDESTSPVVKWEVSRFEMVPIQVRDKSTFPVQTTLEVYEVRETFRWDTEAGRHFHAVKAAYSSTSTLVAPRPGEELIMYLSATHGAISAVLLTDRDSVQTRCYALKLMRGADSAKVEQNDAVSPRASKTPRSWILFTDGSSCVAGRAAGLILTNSGRNGIHFYALRFEFTAENNEAGSTKALIAGLRIAARMGVRNLEANVDSRLVSNHVLGEYVAKEDNMIQYLDKTKGA
ncbi:reverse transcriptase domain-containing protein [Tanacetum coccineum]